MEGLFNPPWVNICSWEFGGLAKRFSGIAREKKRNFKISPNFVHSYENGICHQIHGVNAGWEMRQRKGQELGKSQSGVEGEEPASRGVR